MKGICIKIRATTFILCVEKIISLGSVSVVSALSLRQVLEGILDKALQANKQMSLLSDLEYTGVYKVHICLRLQSYKKR